MVKILNQHRPAVFFSVDNVVRRVKPSASMLHVERHGMAPPVPVEVGEQELIVPVVEYIKKMCEERRAVPIALDMAPYIESKQLSQDQYFAVLAEFKQMMFEFGLTEMKYYVCPHAPEEIPICDPGTGKVVRHEFKPACRCRFPNNELIQRACAENGIHADTDKFGAFRVFPPSEFIGDDQEQREVSVMRSHMNFTWVQAILDGSIYWAGMVDNQIRKEASAVQQEAKKLGNRIGTKLSVMDTTNAMLPKDV